MDKGVVRSQVKVKAQMMLPTVGTHRFYELGCPMNGVAKGLDFDCLKGVHECMPFSLV
jgi:hypothetical protein